MNQIPRSNHMKNLKILISKDKLFLDIKLKYQINTSTHDHPYVNIDE